MWAWWTRTNSRFCTGIVPSHQLFAALARSPNSLSMATSPTVCLNSSSSSPCLVTDCTAGSVSSNFPNLPLCVLLLCAQYSCNMTCVWSWSSSTWLGSHRPRHSAMQMSTLRSQTSEVLTCLEQHEGLQAGVLGVVDPQQRQPAHDFPQPTRVLFQCRVPVGRGHGVTHQ